MALQNCQDILAYLESAVPVYVYYITKILEEVTESQSEAWVDVDDDSFDA